MTFQPVDFSPCVWISDFSLICPIWPRVYSITCGLCVCQIVQAIGGPTSLKSGNGQQNRNRHTYYWLESYRQSLELFKKGKGLCGSSHLLAPLLIRLCTEFSHIILHGGVRCPVGTPSGIITIIPAAGLFVPWQQLWEIEIGLIFIFADEIERISLPWSKIQFPCLPSLLYNKDENGWTWLNFIQI